MAQVIKTTFQLRRGLEKDWIQINPILAAGEPGWTLDTHILKIGDGTHAWNELNSISGNSITEQDVQKAIEAYLKEHPISTVTDATLQVAGQAADAAAVRQQCLFKTDCLILSAGDADDNIFA